MAFSRSFKNNIWHMRLPTGEVVTASSERVERAFRCGLVDGRTLVRSSTAPNWQPLADAAEIEQDVLAAASTPDTVEVLSDQDVAPNWKVSDEDVDPRKIRGSRVLPFSMVGGFLTVLALVGYGVTARADTAHIEIANTAIAPNPTSTGAQRHADREVERRLHDGGRFDAAEIQRLREIDYTHRMQGFGNRNTKWHVVSPSIKAFEPPKGYVPGAAPAPANRWDPLNGAL